MPLWQALWRFVFSGGIDWQTSATLHWSFFIFLFALTYNGLRVVLLVKTKNLELTQESSGLPARFSFEDVSLSGLS